MKFLYEQVVNLVVGGRRIRYAHWALVLLEQVTSSFDYLRAVKVNQIIRLVQTVCGLHLLRKVLIARSTLLPTIKVMTDSKTTSLVTSGKQRCGSRI